MRCYCVKCDHLVLIELLMCKIPLSLSLSFSFSFSVYPLPLTFCDNLIYTRTRNNWQSDTHILTYAQVRSQLFIKSTGLLL